MPNLQLPALLPLYAAHPQVAALTKIISERSPRLTHVSGLHGSAAAMAFASLARRRLKGRPLLFILNEEEEAGYFYHDLTQLLGENDVLFLPSSYRRAVKYGQRDAGNEVLRTQVLGALSPSPSRLLFVVTYPEALSERVAPPTDLAAHTVELRTGETHDMTQLERRLLDLGFRRRDYVYEPGEFAVRGSILDVYGYASEWPYRIDFFGDEIDTIRTFEVQTQLSRDKLEAVSIVPELGAEAGALVPFTDYLPPETVLFVKDMPYVADVLRNTYDEGFARQAQAAQADGGKGGGQPEWAVFDGGDDVRAATGADVAPAELDKAALLTPGDVLVAALQELQRVEFGAKASVQTRARLLFHTTPQPIYHKNFDLAEKSFRTFRERGFTIYITADSKKQIERIRTIFDERGANLDLKGVERTLHAGFSDEDLQACFFTDHEIFDRYHKYNLKSEHARDGKMALTLKEIMEFHPGDYIVHLDHGVGRFAGLVRVPAPDGTQQEMIKLTFQNDDVVLVSIHSLHKLSKYKGREGEAPRLSRLGTGAWEKLKDRTKRKLKDIARDLIRLYSQRQEEKGFAFSPDTYMQQELEAGFAYEDTPDQLRVTQEVKADMESPKPMDRLVCGDVGFGKTEIAVRAALKAAVDGKQVAVLVPTTILALQHFKTFQRRLADFPVRVEYLSRARSPRQVKAITQDLAAGKIDVIVGTHKLIGKGVKFKDLGLLIVDEEQKFGVSVKEKLRQMKTNVDTLTLSATPIPRTLQFSLMGARDFSVISTPPPNRRPIVTEVHTFSHEVIADAINFEMSRNGQVFIVTHRISALQRLKDLVNKYVPDARVAVGHGQMAPAELEQIVQGFVDYDYDVLISTTIVENGIDIPNANTIIIDGANHFGLSDLHQMRGRVGRSERKAFCYLLAPPLAALNADARRRLQAVEEFSDLGAGIHIAMQDLDIRGAGNLLGAEQSGFIADLGYEAYVKILNEAVTEIRNEAPAAAAEPTAQPAPATRNDLGGEVFVAECNIECDLHAFFPETYVPGAGERMALYRELDGITTAAQMAAFRRRMEDRFGALPLEGEELLRIVPLRQLGRRAGAERLSLKQGRMVLYFVRNTDSPFYRSATFDRLLRYATEHYRTTALREEAATPGKPGTRRRMLFSGVHGVQEAIDLLKSILDQPSASA